MIARNDKTSYLPVTLEQTVYALIVIDKLAGEGCPPPPPPKEKFEEVLRICIKCCVDGCSLEKGVEKLRAFLEESK